MQGENRYGYNWRIYSDKANAEKNFRSRIMC